MSTQPHVVVLGAGFAALTTASALRRLRPDVPIRLVAPTRTFLYRPSLIWIPVGLRRQRQVEMSLTRYLERNAIDFTPATVSGLADGGRTVLTDKGRIRNDALVVATGAAYLDDVPGIEHTLPLCDGVASAERVGERLRAMSKGSIAIGCGANPAEPAASRCNPMFELAFGVDTWLRAAGRRSAFELAFFSDAAQPAKRLGPQAARTIWSRLDECDIDARCGEPVGTFTARGIEFADRALDADLVVYTPGMTGPGWLARTDLPRSAGGFVVADEHCAVPGFERVFVAGDGGSYPGPAWSPKLAHMAQLQGKCAAANLDAALGDRAPALQLRHELACVVDTLDGGILVYRDDARSVALPANLPMHWAKRSVERRFLARLSRSE